MVWNRQETGAHTGVKGKNLSPTPPAPPPQRMFLDYKLAPDRSREYEYNLNYYKEFDTRHFYFTNFILLS